MDEMYVEDLTFIISLLFVIPAFLVTYFGIYLYRYLSAKKKNKEIPDTFSDDEIKYRKEDLIGVSIIVGVILAIPLIFILILSLLPDESFQP